VSNSDSVMNIFGSPTGKYWKGASGRGVKNKDPYSERNGIVFRGGLVSNSHTLRKPIGFLFPSAIVRSPEASITTGCARQFDPGRSHTLRLT